MAQRPFLSSNPNPPQPCPMQHTRNPTPTPLISLSLQNSPSLSSRSPTLSFPLADIPPCDPLSLSPCDSSLSFAACPSPLLCQLARSNLPARRSIKRQTHSPLTTVRKIPPLATSRLTHRRYYPTKATPSLKFFSHFETKKEK